MHHLHFLSLASLLLVVALWGVALCEGLAVLWGLQLLARRQRENQQVTRDLHALGRRAPADHVRGA